MILFLSFPSLAAFADEPELVNNLMVSTTAGTCASDRAFFIRTGWCQESGYPNEFDVSTEYKDEGKTKSYDDEWVGTVTGVNWPANQAGVEYETLPYAQAMDRPGTPEPCINKVRFVQGASAFKYKGFSYFVYDMTDKRGCQVTSAKLKFKASPWYSNAAQDGNVTVKIGLYDMKHTCENLTNDAKRECFGALVNDASNNPLQIQFPITWTDYEHFEIDVKDSVQADLFDADASGYVGFMFGSRDFGTYDIDYAPGIRNFGFTEVVLEVELGSCSVLPTVTAINPNSGPVAGGTAVAITGTNFAAGATVTFGGTAATGVTVDSSTSISATAPAHTAGSVDVTVTNPDTQSATLASGFRYEGDTPIPTLQEWGMILFALLMGAAAFWRFRKRRNAA